MASVFGHELSDEPDQLSDDPHNRVCVTAHPFRGSDRESVGAAGMPATSAKQKWLVSDLDQRAAEPTPELATPNGKMTTEIDEHRKVKAHLLERQAALNSILLSARERAEAIVLDTQQVCERILCEVSPIGETSPSNTELSY
jgi:hypothetical protein